MNLNGSFIKWLFWLGVFFHRLSLRSNKVECQRDVLQVFHSAEEGSLLFRVHFRAAFVGFAPCSNRTIIRCRLVILGFFSVWCFVMLNLGFVVRLRIEWFRCVRVLVVERSSA